MRFRSAGIFASPGAPPSAYAVAALRELGLRLEDHQARQLHPDMLREATHVIPMTRNHKELILNMVPEAREKTRTLCSFGSEDPDADIMDPFGGNLDTYRLVRDEISAALSDLILTLIRPPNPEGNSR